MADTTPTPRVLCTFPGKFGDLLWALPTVRAVSEAIGAPVDLVIAGAFASIVPLLTRQPYLRRVWAMPAWTVRDTAPISPRVPPSTQAGGVPIVEFAPGTYDQVLHLGYVGWPERPLPYEVERMVTEAWPHTALAHLRIDLTRPWITAPYPLPTYDLAVGFTDEYFELKVGVWKLLWARLFAQHGEAAIARWVNISHGPRWQAEGQNSGFDWETAASFLAHSAVFLGDCSALHVLACAVGTPCVLLEPAEARHHPIFWPYGTTGPQVTQVLGGDGRWTWDARHVWDTIAAVQHRPATTRRATSGVSGT